MGVKEEDMVIEMFEDMIKGHREENGQIGIDIIGIDMIGKGMIGEMIEGHRGDNQRMVVKEEDKIGEITKGHREE